MTELPSMPPTRIRHRGDKIDQRGRVSALCFQTPRAIDMKRWELCLLLLGEHPTMALACNDLLPAHPYG